MTPESTTESTSVEPEARPHPQVSWKDRLAKVNPLHSAATMLRKGAILADKLPTPGEIARKTATRIDAVDPRAYAKRVEELRALEARVETHFAAGSGK